MDKKIQQQALADTVGKKFRGRQQLQSKVVPHFPQSAEREYERISRELMLLYDKILRAHMPELKRALMYYGGKRFDDVPRSPDEIFAEIDRQFDAKLLSFNMREKLDRIANMNRKLKIAEWKRVCQRTLGVDIFEDYYKGEFFQQAMDTWVQENIDLIVTQPKDSLTQMREIVRQGYEEGRRPEAIAKDINGSYDSTKSHAEFIARDQTAKLNSALTRSQQQDAGVNMYIWDTSRDQRVRDTHRRMHGKYFRWGDVTVYSDDKGKTWKKKTLDMANIKGKFVHPGEDYQCRCVAIPVFNMEGIAEIPIAAVDWETVDNRTKKVGT